MVAGVEFVGKGIDILNLGSGSSSDAMKAHVVARATTDSAFLSGVESTKAKVGQLLSQEGERICIPRHDNPMIMPGEIHTIADYTLIYFVCPT